MATVSKSMSLVKALKEKAYEYKLNQVFVPGQGDLDASMMLVGEAPGKTEAIRLEPFRGYSGKMLTDCCKDAQVSRSSCYITNVAKHKPYGNDFSVYYEDSAGKIKHVRPTKALKLLYELLALEIEIVQPNVIVALGRHALFALTGKTSIHKYRGSILPCSLVPGYKVLAAMHPQAIQYQYEMRSLLVLDLVKAKRESQYPEIKLPQRKFYLKPTFAQAMRYFELIEQSGFCSFDIENDRGRRIIDCIALSASPEGSHAICIPFCYLGRERYILEHQGKDIVNYWSVEEEMQIWRRLDSIFSNPLIKKIAMNALYDWSYIASEHGIKFKNVWHDVMLSHHNCYAEMPKSLAFIVSVYSDEPYFKDDQKELQHLSPSLRRWTYNCKDAAVTGEVVAELNQEVIDQRVESMFKFDMAMLEPLVYMTLQGLRVDHTLRDKLIKQYREEFGYDIPITKSKKEHTSGWRERDFWKQVGYEINVLSPTQMSKLLYQDLGYKEIRKRGTGKVAADKHSIMKCYYKKANPLLKEAIQLRQGKDFLSDYLLASLDPKTQRLHCSFNWTETFRLTSSQAPFENGRNLMNLPHNDARRMIIPNPGRELGAADLMGAEAHVVAFMVRDEALLSLFAQGKSVHAFRGSMMYGVPAEEIKKGSDRYIAAKKGVHAVHYDVGRTTFMEILNEDKDVPYTQAEANLIYNLIQLKIPTAARYQELIQAELKQTRTLWNLFGRRRTFYGRWSSSMLREAYAWIPQSIVPDVVNKGLMKVYYNYSKYVNILMQIHDELLFEYKPADRRIAHEIVHEAMSTTLHYKERSMMMGVEHSYGDNWLEMEGYRL